MMDDPANTLDEELEGCARYKLEDDGSFIKEEEEEEEEDKKVGKRASDDDRWVVDASRLVQDEAQLGKVLTFLKTHADRLLALRISGAKLDVASANRLCATLWNPGQFRRLLDVDYAYMRMSFESISLMCNMLDPATKGCCCSIRRLVLTRMELGHRGTEQLFGALYGNIFVEELVLGGNGCTDAALPTLARTMRNSRNRFRLLGLGGNDITAAGMRTLSAELQQHAYLAELELQGNPLGDEGSDVLFQALRDNTTLESLNLSNCKLKEIPWAGRLRIMTTLSDLNVSQNDINDKGCQVLASALEGCFCLRYLDMSHNLFGGRLATGLGEAVKLNKGLLQLRLSSNPMIFEVWNALAYGLMENRTLMTLDLTWCDLDMKAAAKLAEALAVNDICDVVTDLNPLPDVLRMTPRLYRQPGWPEGIPLHPKAAGISLEAGQAWRSAKIADIKLSKEALAVVKRAGADLGLPDPEAGVEGEGEEEDERSHASASGLLSVSASINVSPGAHRAKMLAARIQEADEQAESGFGGRMVLTVCYGRPSEVLGSIEVTHFTTYAAAKALVRPLVETYLAALGSLQLAGALLDNFSVLDPSGQAVRGNEALVRTLWDEAVTNDYTVLLRPGNWITLEEGDEDDELDDEALGGFEGAGLEGAGVLVPDPVQVEFDSLRKVDRPWHSGGP